MNITSVSSICSLLSENQDEVEGVIAVDSNWLIHRSSNAFSSLAIKISGVPVFTGDIYGYCKTIVDIARKKPTYAIVLCCDHAENDRKAINPDYKGNRDEHDGIYSKWEKSMRSVSMLPNVYIAMERGKEADDIMFTIAAKFSQMMKVILFTKDDDISQATQFENVVVMSSFAKDAEVKDAAYFEAKYEVHPSKMSLYKSLVGDSSDNLPGYSRMSKEAIHDFFARGVKTPDELLGLSTDALTDIGRTWLKRIQENPGLLRENYQLMHLRPIPIRIFKMEGTMEYIKYYQLKSIESFMDQFIKPRGASWSEEPIE